VSGRTTDADAADDPHVGVAVVGGTPTAEELAALIAVVNEAYAGEAAAAVAEDVQRSAWSISQRGLGRPIPREFGWRGFSG
jgi:hypothetical protein